MDFLIITGLSGAGKSCVVDAFEDIGWFCVDNLPVKLIPEFVKQIKSEGKHGKVAVVTDIRAGLTAVDLDISLKQFEKSDINVKLLFVDCNCDVLFTRYKQSRRIHPLMNRDGADLGQAIEKENRIFTDIKLKADYVIDTTGFSVISAKQRIVDLFCEDKNKSMHIHCMSFGFKHGIPKDTDVLFDARFLPNPFYIDELKNLTGLDNRVSSFVMDNESAVAFEAHILRLTDFMVPRCIEEGRGQLVISVGCTGGHHRSVTLVQRMYEHLKLKGYSVSVTHRDIEK